MTACNVLCFYIQGANISQLERDIGSDQFPPNEHYFGLVNVSLFFLNTQILIFIMFSLYNVAYSIFLWHVPCCESYFEGGCRNTYQLSLENELCICR